MLPGADSLVSFPCVGIVRKIRKLSRSPKMFFYDMAQKHLAPPPPPPPKPPSPADHEVKSRKRFLKHFGERCDERPFYNYGAGDWRHPFFQNVDIENPNYPQNTPDIVHNAFDLEPLPISSDSAEIFYFSHVNEHLPDKQNHHLFAEVFRCLRPGGTLRIVYPDIDLAYEAYLRKDREFFLERFLNERQMGKRPRAHMANLLLDFFATRALGGSPKDGNRKYKAEEFQALVEELGYIEACDHVARDMLEEPQRTRPNTHINWWNHDKMNRSLGKHGFVNITRSAFLGSHVPPLRDSHYFDYVCAHLAGYVEARKPD